MESKTIRGLEKSLVDLLKVTGRPVRCNSLVKEERQSIAPLKRSLEKRLNTCLQIFFSNEAKFGVLSENNGKALRDLRKEADMTRFG